MMRAVSMMAADSSFLDFSSASFFSAAAFLSSAAFFLTAASSAAFFLFAATCLAAASASSSFFFLAAAAKGPIRSVSGLPLMCCTTFSMPSLPHKVINLAPTDLEAAPNRSCF